MADTPQAPTIEFPCRYPIKVIGTAAEDFTDLVVTIVEQHTETGDVELVDVRDSKNGRFVSVRIRITATGEEQLQALHLALKSTGRVHMVL